MGIHPPEERHRIRKERDRLLLRIKGWTEGPMVVLGFVWLILLILELTRGLSPLLETLSNVIWGIFVAHFLLLLAIAPDRSTFLKTNLLTLVSLALPALRIFRIVRLVRFFRIGRAVRGLRLLKVIGSLNRGMRALGKTMRRRGAGYVFALTITVTLVGAAGMYALESNLPDGQGLNDYGSALWWTAMLMTTMGSEYWPKTAEGRLLCVFLALYAAGVFGYVTAAVASYFVGRDADSDEGEVAGERSVAALRHEIAALRSELRALLDQNRHRPPEGP